MTLFNQIQKTMVRGYFDNSASYRYLIFQAQKNPVGSLGYENYCDFVRAENYRGNYRGNYLAFGPGLCRGSPLVCILT
mgnify:CR=1 FL=1